MSIRDKIQKEAEEVFYDNDNSGILLIAQRVGKTRIACNIIKKLYHKYSKIEIYVPFTYMIDNTWNVELMEMFDEIPKNITYRTHKSIASDKELSDSFKIIDEIHLLSPAQQKKLKLGSEYLGLTGTMNRFTAYDLKKNSGMKTIYQYSLMEAIKDGIIADFRITVVHCSLDDKKAYIPSGNKTHRFFTTEKKAYKYYTDTFNKWSLDVEEYGDSKSVKMRNLIAGVRYRFIKGLWSKSQAVKKLLLRNTDKRILIFAPDTEAAAILAVKNYHSKSDGTELKEFNNLEFNHLACCKMLQVGITIPKLSTLVIQQLDSNEENTSQILARALNLEYEGKIADIHIFVAKGTVDEYWLNRSITWIPDDRITHINDTDI